MLWIGLIAIFTSLFFIIKIVGAMIISGELNVLKRLKLITVSYSEKLQTQPNIQKNQKINESDKRKELRKGFLLKYMNSIEAELAKTNLLLHPKEYLIFVTGFSLLLGIIFYAAAQKIIIGIIGVVIALVIVRVFINMKKSQRITKLNQQLADTINLISNGLKAGYSFMQAVDMVTREMRPPMSEEFNRMARQMNMGLPTEEALKKLSERVESQDMDLVITAILIQRQIGGNLSEILDKIVETIQGRVRLKKEISVKTAQGRISGIVLILLTPCLGFLMYLLNPQFIGVLFTNQVGRILIGISVILQAIGIYFMIKLINIDV